METGGTRVVALLVPYREYFATGIILHFILILCEGFEGLFDGPRMNGSWNRPCRCFSEERKGKRCTMKSTEPGGVVFKVLVVSLLPHRSYISSTTCHTYVS